MTGTTNAVHIVDYGGPEVMRFGPLPRPVPAGDEVLIRFRAGGVNPVDWKTREGARRARMPLTMPAILGCDVAGEVLELGPGATGFAPGDAVYAMRGLNGAFGEVVAVKAAHVAPRPATLDAVTAAAVPLAALTAWQALELMGLAAGARVLVHAGAGGVGGFAVQFARARGLEVVATASGANAAYVRGLGASRVVDHRAERFEDALSGMDGVFDLLGGDTQARSWGVLKPDGVLITSVALPEEDHPARAGRRAARVGVTANGAQLREIGRLIDAGEVRVEVAATYPLSEAPTALERSKEGHTRGKIVLVAAD